MSALCQTSAATNCSPVGCPLLALPWLPQRAADARRSELQHLELMTQSLQAGLDREQLQVSLLWCTGTCVCASEVQSVHLRSLCPALMS